MLRLDSKYPAVRHEQVIMVVIGVVIGKYIWRYGFRRTEGLNFIKRVMDSLDLGPVQHLKKVSRGAILFGLFS
jgi:TRAP-type mannitol/chloroaromatic compound transport system permease large subunit